MRCINPNYMELIDLLIKSPQSQNGVSVGHTSQLSFNSRSTFRRCQNIAEYKEKQHKTT